MFASPPPSQIHPSSLTSSKKSSQFPNLQGSLLFRTVVSSNLPTPSPSHTSWNISRVSYRRASTTQIRLLHVFIHELQGRHKRPLPPQTRGSGRLRQAARPATTQGPMTERRLLPLPFWDCAWAKHLHTPYQVDNGQHTQRKETASFQTENNPQRSVTSTQAM